MTAVTGPGQRTPALLVTADGAVFAGEAAGASVPVATGELVFNTAMSGYQEVITDPSYAGQVISFTSTHIGNYGTNAADDEALVPHCPRRRGVRPGGRAVELAGHRGPRTVPAPPRRAGALTGVDTRRLARHVRVAGAVPCAFGTASERELREAAAAAVGYGRDGPGERRDRIGAERARLQRRSAAAALPDAGLRVVAYDFGVKTTMVQLLTTLGTVTVVPAGTTADDVLALEPDGVFLSNGPGDPAALPGPAAAIADLVGRVPDLRHLPRPPDPGHGARRHDLQAAVRPPRRQPSGAAPRDRRRRDHEPEPQLRRRRRLDPRRRDDAREPQRRRGRGVPLAEGAGVLGAVPPRGRARSARRRATCSARSATSCWPIPPQPPAPPGRAGRAGRAQHRATPRRPAHDPRDRVRPDRDRPGLRVRLLGHPGLPGPAPRRATASSWPTPTRPRS